VSRPPLSGFVISSKKGDDLPSARTKEGFDPNAYKLMERASYDFQNPTILGKVVEEKPHGLTETQGKIQEQGGSVGVFKVGLGFTPPQLVRISGRRKDKKFVIQHMSTEEIDVSEDENASPNPKPSMFDRPHLSTSKKTSVSIRPYKEKKRSQSLYF